MIPRSLTSRLFLAIAVVSATALLLGAWLVRRAVRLDLKEDVIVMHPDEAGGDVEHIVRNFSAPDPGGLRLSPADALDRRVLAALAIVIGGAALATMLMARRVVRPVARLRSAADQMAGGNLGVRVPVKGHDEIAALARAFNAMADKLQEDERLRRDLANDVAHELRTPLTNLRCHLEALQDRVAFETPDTVPTLLAEVLHLHHLVEDLGDLARAEAGQLALHIGDVALEPIVSHLSSELGSRVAAAGLTLEAKVPADLPPLAADPVRLTQVLRNLLDNAVAHTPPGGRITLTANARPPVMHIEVADTGSGIAAPHLPHVFERFYRTDPSRSRATGGAGLGLAIVRQFVVAHGGQVHAESPSDQGARFILEWPLASGSSS